MSATLLAAVSGALVVLSYAPYGYYALSFVSLVPLFTATASRRPAAAAGLGFIAGTMVYGVGCTALLPAAAALQSIDWTQALPLYAVVVTYHALPWSVAGMASGALQRRASPAGVAACWTVVEWSFPVLIPWHLGSVLGPSRLLRQAADLGGVHGLGFVIVLVNAWLAQGLLRRRHGRLANVPSLAAAVGLMMAMLAYGRVRLATMPAAPGVTHTIALVQSPGRQGGDPALADAEAWRRYAAVSHRAVSADVVVWPESVVRVYLRDNPGLRQEASDLALALDAPLLLGALDRAPEQPGELNSAYLVHPPAPLAVYHKAALVPFAEYVPRWWPWRWQTTGAFVPGRSPRPLDVETRHGPLRLGVSICYEAALPGWFNPLVRDGAALLVNLTDDSWFGEGAAIEQHLELTRLRAVETRRWLIRASGSGISALIDPSGEIVATVPIGAVGVLSRRLTTRDMVTPYVRYGDWVAGLAAVLVVGSARRCVCARSPSTGS